MCQLLGMNSHLPASLTLSFTGFSQRGGCTDHHTDGWGIAFFEADGLTPGNAIRLVSRDMMDAQSPTWRTVERSPVECFMFDPDTPRYFEVTPGVPVGPAVRWVRIAYTAQPAKIPNTGTVGGELYKIDGANTTLISVHDENVDDLVNYVCARAFMRNSQNAGDPNKVAMYSGLFLNSLNAKVAAVTGSNPNLKQLPFAPTPIGQAGS